MMINKITSLSNPIVKDIAALKNKKYRKESGLFLIEGPKLAAEALESGIRIRYALANRDFLSRNNDIIAKLAATGCSIYEVDDTVISKAADTKSPQGVVCAAEMPAAQPFSPKENRRYLSLFELSDPGNLGAVLRSAEAFKADGVLIGKGCADVYSPKAVRGSMGSLFRVPYYIIDDTAQMIYTLRKQNFTVYAACLQPPFINVQDAYAGNGGYVTIIGGEAAGLPANIINACSASVFIPMSGKVQSLNAAVAASIIMFCQSCP